MRHNNRPLNGLRPIKIIRQYTEYAEGSVLIEYGNTKVICNATVASGVPNFLKDTGQGWITAEYGMLPRSTQLRMSREATKGKQVGRTVEIQRLIGRSLRAAVDLSALGENTILIDCDVIQADGGTRTAAITGGCVALYDAVSHLKQKMCLSKEPFQQFIASISAGIVNQEILLDLDYQEDSQAETDMNVVMTENRQFIEIQGTAEKRTFTREELSSLLSLSEQGITALIHLQKDVCLRFSHE